MIKVNATVSELRNNEWSEFRPVTESLSMLANNADTLTSFFIFSVIDDETGEEYSFEQIKVLCMRAITKRFKLEQLDKCIKLSVYSMQSNYSSF